MEKILSSVAEYMALSALTAPKCMGEDCVGIRVVTGRDVKHLAREMMRFGKKSNKVDFDRDAGCVERSSAVVLISLRSNKPLGLNCGACGLERCANLEKRKGPEFEGPLCAWRVLDVGIAIGSAVKTASLFNADNRVMYRAGVAARKLGMIEGDIVVGIPVAAHSKNIFFDRPEKTAKKME